MKVKVGIVGCGVVGTGVVELLLKNYHTIRKKTGIELQISKDGRSSSKGRTFTH